MGGPLGHRGARRDGRVPQPRAVEVDGEPDGGDRREARQRPDPPADLAVRVLHEHGRRRHPPDLGIGGPPGDLRRVEGAVGVVERDHLHGRVGARGGRLPHHEVLAAPASTADPGGASSRSAIWLAIVPDGTNSDASFPTRSAKAASSRATVGSSPNPSSPTSASAMARRISGVGRVTVSLRRSTRPWGSGTSGNLSFAR